MELEVFFVEQEIVHMEARLFRMFTEQTGLSPKDAADVFTRGKVLPFIRDCYGLLHLSSDLCALDDVLHMLKAKGVYPS